MTPEEYLADVEWLMTCLVTHGANGVKVDLDGKRIEAIHFRFPSGRECTLEYPALRPALPYLIISRGCA